MAFDKFSFDPADGFVDSGFYEDTPPDSREILQRQHNQTRDYINSVVGKLGSVKAGESGSENIGSPKIDGVEGENVFSQIKDIKRQLVNATAGTISDGSVDEAKLAAECVTKEKLAKESVLTEHFAPEAVAPYANECNNLNGYSADMYLPVSKSAELGFFKERMTDTAVLDASGKIHNGYRYYINGSGKIMKMSLKDFSESEYLDCSAYNHSLLKFAFDENDDLYIAVQEGDYEGIYVSISKYELGAITFINKIKIAPYTSYYCRVNDIAIYNGDMYIAFSTDGSYAAAYIYKIPCSEIYSTDEIASYFAEGVDTIVTDKMIIFKDGDLYFYKWRLKGCDANACEQYSWVFLGYSDGKFAVSHKNIILVDENLLPCFASYSDMHYLIEDSFLYDGYLYSVISGYMFRTRLF